MYKQKQFRRYSFNTPDKNNKTSVLLEKWLRCGSDNFIFTQWNKITRFAYNIGETNLPKTKARQMPRVVVDSALTFYGNKGKYQSYRLSVQFNIRPNF